jgi:L-asparaginase II
MRGPVLEAEHRGHVVEVDAGGRILRALGDVETQVTLR